MNLNGAGWWLVGVVLGLAQGAWAQTASSPQAPAPGAATSELRAERLMDDRNVENRQGESLGEIEDLVIDRSTGRVHFAVLETERLLGLRERLIAFRLSDFEVGGNGKLVLDVARDALKQRQGFDDDAWPAWSDPYWTALLGDSGASTGAAIRPQAMNLLRADDLLDEDVHDRQGNELGEIEDLIIDTGSRTVTHLVIDVENSSRDVRVPWSALSKASGGALTLDLDRQALLQMPEDR